MAREAKLRCPNCGTQVTVFEDEIGESGHCPGCGSDMEVLKHDFGARKHGSARGGKKSLAARVAKLVGRAGEKGAETPDEDEDNEVVLPEGERSDGDMLAGLIEEDADGIAAAEAALQEIDLPAQDEEPVPDAAQDEEPAPAEAVDEEHAPVEAKDEEPPAMAEDEPTPAQVPARGEPIPQETEYRIWQGLAEEAGDRAMAARLDLWLQAELAGCAMTLEMPDGVRVPLPQIVLAEAAAARAGEQDEGAWRDGWTRRLLKMASEWPDEDTIEGVVTVLNHTDPVVDDLKTAGVWPWAAGEDAS